MDKRSFICRITIATGKTNRVEDIEKSPFTVGRGSDVDVQILSPGVSRVHLSVEVKGQEIWIEDLGSANGTEISGIKMTGKKPTLYKWDQPIRLGVHEELLSLALVEKIPASEIPAPPHFEKTYADQKFQEPKVPVVASAAVVVSAHTPIPDEKLLQEAKASALKIKIEAETEATKLIQEAKSKALTEIATGRERAEEIISSANELSARMKREGETESTEMRKALQLAVADLHAEAEQQADSIRKEAREKGEILLAEYRTRSEKLVSDARLSATVIKSEAQRDADSIISQAHQKGMEIRTISEAAVKTTLKEHDAKVATMILNAQAESDGILEEAKNASFLIRKNIDKELGEIRARAEAEAELIAKAAREQGEFQKEKILKIAFEEADKIKEHAVEVGKQEASAHLKTAEENRVALINASEKIQLEIAEYEKKRIETADANHSLYKKNLELKTESEQVSKKLNDSQSEAQKKIDDLNSKIISAEALLKAKNSEVLQLKDESKRVLEVASQAEISVQNIKQEKENILKSIEDLKKEIIVLREVAGREIKQLREKAQSEFNQRKAEQDSELSILKNKEIDAIKGMRFQEETNFKASRKHQIMEISKALEMFIVPRIREGMKGFEIPRSLNNLFPEITEMVKRVIEEEYSEKNGKAASRIASSRDSDASLRKKRDTYVIVGSGVAIVFFIAMAIFKNGDGVTRKPASEVFMDRLHEKQANKPKFAPRLTDDYKSTYSDNVLYTNNYIAFKTNPDNQARWIRDLNKFFINDLGLNENAIVKFISTESSLIGQLKDLREVVHIENEKEDIRKLTELEQRTLPELKMELGGEEKYQAFREFEKNFIRRNRTPAGAAAPSDGH